MSFDDLINKWSWRPIRNCPGRFVLDKAAANISLAELLGEGIEVSEFQVDAAKDAVLVARLNRGGIISYKRKDGSLLHTLNTVEGFERKLRQLGIKLPGETGTGLTI
ncbi:MAG TPA: hypothetical protein VNI02_14050 [Blastocatellia bacterium]|jgi:hypothetical protein|nr:hypothetical protein [Blastocatellia bacterium]